MRNESEWFEFIKKGEKVSSREALAYLKETAKCWVTGDSTNLSTFPVDFNPDNILPSNMVSVKESFLKTDTIPKQYSYYVNWGDYTLKIHTPEFMEEKNKEIIASVVAPDFKSGSDLYGAWDELTLNHVKGLEEVRHGDHVLESYVAMSYFIKKTTLNLNSSSGLKLV